MLSRPTKRNLPVTISNTVQPALHTLAHARRTSKNRTKLSGGWKEDVAALLTVGNQLLNGAVSRVSRVSRVTLLVAWRLVATGRVVSSGHKACSCRHCKYHCSAAAELLGVTWHDLVSCFTFITSNFKNPFQPPNIRADIHPWSNPAKL